MKTSEIVRLYSLPPEEFCFIRSTIKISHRRLKRRIEKLNDLELLRDFHAKEIAYRYRFNKLTLELKSILNLYD